MCGQVSPVFPTPLVVAVFRVTSSREVLEAATDMISKFFARLRTSRDGINYNQCWDGNQLSNMFEEWLNADSNHRRKVFNEGEALLKIEDEGICCS